MNNFQKQTLDKCWFVCPEFEFYWFENLSEYLAYSEGEPDYLYGDPETGYVFDHLSDYVAWIKS